MGQVKNKIAISGAAGSFGRMVLEELKRKGVKNVIAATREPEKLKDFEKAGYEVRFADFDDKASLIPAFKGAKKLLLISTNAFSGRVKQHENAIKAAKELGIKHIVYTSWGNTDNSRAQVSKDHIETEKLIIESGINYTILRNYSYAENLIPALKEAVETGVLKGAAGEGKVAFITKHDCALAAVSALIKDDEENKILELSGGHSYSYDDIAKMVGELKNKEVTYKNLTNNEYTHHLEKSGYEKDLASFLSSFDDSYKHGEMEEVTDSFQKLVGHKPQNLKDFIRQELRS